MSMGRTYKFFGFSISHTILNLPLSILNLLFMLLILCIFSPFLIWLSTYSLSVYRNTIGFCMGFVCFVLFCLYPVTYPVSKLTNYFLEFFCRLLDFLCGHSFHLQVRTVLLLLFRSVSFFGVLVLLPWPDTPACVGLGWRLWAPLPCSRSWGEGRQCL